ncbi:adenosylcobinamide-phosphate synthase CbiB [Pseudoruegeria sp. SHC-113]|uniref:adenosylcobinamide-phosphate synthase CbiB n=1 Tax=Pseudoruegeria sp. SHC-113 TaxID=2855439 RepID=UPI0021BB9121|nr:adenosylcobinamide-phosphate synthase CbiB [Pseudoruegeria sp. SHC-113]MCT8159200.1 adenosylcobinamide-phosphate synthase CbiB [Pseudoruegeria sp. SHC-113]
MSHAAALLLAALLDAALGEPKWLWDRLPHPAVLMGRVIGWADARFNRGVNRREKGLLLLAVLCGGAWALGGLIAALPFGDLWEVLIAAVLLAQKSLVQHVAAVADGLRAGLPEGRRAVAMIVGRDTATMDAPATARAAIESAAENLSDGVIAPAFWFLLLGLPGLMVYKITNTADSMIGYRTPHHEAFGWASARFDDLLNWIPARLTSVLIMASSAPPKAWPRLWQVIRRDAPLHRSPNAGWPEAAMAASLNVALSGPRSYEGQMCSFPWVYPEGRRQIGADEIDAAAARLWRAWATGLALTFALALA